jgi:subtilisin family serine protease
MKKMKFLLLTLAPSVAAATTLLIAATATASSGSGSDGTPDDKIEEEIAKDIEKQIEDQLKDRLDGKIEDRAEERVRDRAKDKAGNRAEEKIREKSEKKSRKNEKRLRDERKFEKEIEKRARDGNGDKSRSRERVKEERKSDLKSSDNSEGSSPMSGVAGAFASVMDKAAIERAKNSAKTTFEIAKAAANTGRKIGRADARAAMEAAMAQPGADKKAIDAAYKNAVKAADLQRDVSIDEADAVYRATLEQLDAIEDGDSGHGSDDDVIASAERIFVAATDANGDEIAHGEWLLLTTQKDVDAIVKRGFAVKSIEVMNGLGVVLARLEAPESFSLPETSRAVMAETPGARVDYNHLYFPEAEILAAESGDQPSTLMPMKDATRGAGIRIGVIDTEIDRSHPALLGTRMIVRGFVGYQNARPADHGTAVASIIAGEDEAFSGLTPKADIIAASVFFESAGGRASATTESLVRALDWMAEMDVPIVSMSLAGPPNTILEEAIVRAADRGIMIVAAAGNEGPMARPMYPAAYPPAVAVTAVSRDRLVYRLANRGDYVDLAAPGVSVRHAKNGGGYSVSSGTSMAAPFVATALAELRRGDAHSAAEAFQLLIDNAEDLGAPGKDPVYGAGLVRPIAN